MIYLDYAASTPMSKQALDVYTKLAADVYANTESLHDNGTNAKAILEKCRGEVAHALGAEPNGIYFTSGGTESNILAVLSLLKRYRHKGRHILSIKSEHSSILNLLKKLELEHGYEVTYLPIDEKGKLSPEALVKSIRNDTVLAAIQHVNGETGAVQDIDTIGAILSERRVLFHCDAVQSFGKLKLDVKRAHITSLSISSHKIYGPKGVGACYISPSASVQPLFPDTVHEGGLRPGTVNLPGIGAFTAAASEHISIMDKEYKRIDAIRNHFIDLIKNSGYPIAIESDPISTLPHILALRIKGLEGQLVMLSANQKGVAISTGSACQAGHQEPSQTLLAMGRTKDEARELIRLSFGHETDIDTVHKAFNAIKEAINEYSLKI
ncbi:cysteine desulfurase [Scopulibacillus daqui]|uniref:Cysteine desulfurase n=1 Tax=Scopulibacillus daqui TaxID=1469162 RepID=A0ABS2Q1F0_9BACL|nr:IscS subfamily cysteine desulfurase [Scopulibacillus daqui]MBM7646104.1 cysteine desulfurase [Scopulibacillus daqui]